MAKNSKNVIFTNGTENYLLRNNVQENIPCMKKKYIRNAVDDKEQFYISASKDYDRDIDVLST